MTEEKINEYMKMLNNLEISIEMLISCIANLEPLISKAAYKMKQYQNSYMNQYNKYFEDDPNSYKNRFKTYISYRNVILKILNNPPLEEIREIIKGYKKSDIVSNLMRDQILELIRSEDFVLVEQAVPAEAVTEHFPNPLKRL